MSRNFNLWLLLFLVQAIIISIAGYLGFFNLLYLYDHTFLGFTSITLWTLVSLSVGNAAYHGSKPFEWHWFFSDLFMAFGLFGTAVGLAYVMFPMFTVDIRDFESLVGLIKNIASGMATALFTTMCGIATSYFMKSQLVLVDHGSKDVVVASKVELLVE